MNSRYKVLLANMLVFVLGFISGSALLLKGADGPHFATKEELRDFASENCNSELLQNDVLRIQAGLSSKSPEHIIIKILPSKCSFSYEDVVGRSDISGFGSAVTFGKTKIFLMYNIFSEISDGRISPSILLAQYGLEEAYFLQ